MFLFIPLLINRSFKVVIFTTCFISLVVFLTVVLTGKEVSFYYLSNILYPLFSGSAGAVYYNQSLTGFFARINITGVIPFISRICLFIVSLFLIYKNKPSLLIGISFFITLLLLISNFTWQHYLIYLLIPYYFILGEKINSKLFIPLVFSYLAVAYNIKNFSNFTSSFYGSIYLSHGVFGVLLLWLILAWMITHHEKI